MAVCVRWVQVFRAVPAVAVARGSTGLAHQDSAGLPADGPGIG